VIAKDDVLEKITLAVYWKITAYDPNLWFKILNTFFVE
jgi:hypothetical protein